MIPLAFYPTIHLSDTKFGLNDTLCTFLE